MAMRSRSALSRRGKVINKPYLYRPGSLGHLYTGTLCVADFIKLPDRERASQHPPTQSLENQP